MNELFKGKPFSYYEGLDKRTKEYKEYIEYIKNSLTEETLQEEALEEIKEKQVEYTIEKGLGDVIEDITTKTGIKWAVKKLFGEDCGCEKRSQEMNSNINLRFFSKRRGNELTEKEFLFLVDYFSLKQGQKHSFEDVKQMQDVYKRVFNESPSKKYTTCGSCVKGMEQNLEKVLEYYKSELKK